MSKLRELRSSLKSITDEMEKLSNACHSEKGEIREFTKEENEQYEGLKSRAKSIRSAIAREEELGELSTEASSGEEVRSTRPEIQVTRAENHNEKGEYRGFKTLGEQLTAIRGAALNPGKVDNRLHEVRAAVGLSEGVNSDGGFLLQSDFIVELDTSVMKNASLAQFCAKRPIGANSNGTSEPYMAESSRADGSRHGGAQAFWEQEAGTITKSKPTFESLDLKLKKLTALIVATDEINADAVQLGSYINEVYQEEMGFKLDAGIIEGVGVGMPLGFANSGAVVEVAKASGQNADTIVAQNCLDMYAAMTPRGQQRGIWLVNPQGWGQLPAMSIGNQPVFLPPGGLTGQQYATLLGRPVINTEICEKLGDAGDFWFVDLQAYRLIERGGIDQASSIHVYFDTAQTAYRFIHRVNGAPRVKSAVTPYKANSGFKVSPFVRVAARA